MPTIGCVSYLNARPLVDGLENIPEIRLTSDVPSRLLQQLSARTSDLALVPIIDYQTSDDDLCIVPCGAIGSNGETLTVRVFASLPFQEVRTVAVDGDSRTSVALLQLVFHDAFGTRPRLEPLGRRTSAPGLPAGVDACLLIGDKVVNSAPQLPHQLDLGEAWHSLTGMPFVFAAWMARPTADLGDLPQILARTRDLNRRRIPDIAARHARSAGWPVDLAERYLGDLLRYDLGQRELKAVDMFWRRCHELGIIDDLRPLVMYEDRGGRGLEASSGP
jgi:chorismate dehydratase